MTIATKAQLENAEKELVSIFKSASITATVGLIYTNRHAGGLPGSLANLSAGAATALGDLPVQGEAGSPNIKASPGKDFYLQDVTVNTTSQPAFSIMDIVWYAGAFNVTTTGSVSTTFVDSPYEPRVLSYEGLTLWVEVVTALTGTGAVIEIVYMNNNGVSGRTTGNITLTSSTATAAGRWIPIPLQAGDSGIMGVEAINFVSAGTAGTYNVVITREVFKAASSQAGSNRKFGIDKTNLVNISPDACLVYIQQAPNTGTGVVKLEMTIAKN